MLNKISKNKGSKYHRVGFVIDFDNWLGGINYFKNLFEAIYLLQDRKIEVVILCGRKIKGDTIENFTDFTIIKSSLFDRFSVKWLIARFCKYVLKNRNFLLRRLLFANNINIISHIISPTSIPGEYKDIRSIGWIPDFQHKLLPEFNSPAVCTVRDKLNNLLFSKCSTVVVSSNSAKAHAMKFYNFVHEKIHVLQFAVNTLPVSDLVSNSELQEKFNYSGRFLYLPNQYWAHKNHRIVIDAINSLRKQGKRVLVISTGITNDYRHPELFNSIQSYVKELGVGDQYRILGPIPYRFVHSFMVNCVSIINPSNFEGWSTTVEEGKALGKMLILSKIDVHLEQNPPRCIYFDQSNAEELAQAMWNTWDSFDPEVEKKEMEEAKLVSKDRVKQFGQRFQKIALGDMIID